MHAGIKQINWYSSCLSSHQSLGKALRNSWGHTALQADHKHQEQDCWRWHAELEKWLSNPPLLCLSQQSQPCHFRLRRHSAALAQWSSWRRVAQECHVFALGACGLVSMRKIWTYPSTGSREEKTPEETVCASLADTKAPLSPEMPIQLTIQWVYVHGSNKIISRLRPPAELLGAASTGFFPVPPSITTTGPGDQCDGKTHHSHALEKMEHAALSVINQLKWIHLVCSKCVYTWH